MRGENDSDGDDGCVRCAVYLRSDNIYGTGSNLDSLIAQHDLTDEYIKARAEKGWSLCGDEYVDRGFPADDPERPALNELLCDICEGLVDVLVVHSFDRLVANFQQLACLVGLLCANDVDLVCVRERIDTTVGAKRYLYDVLRIIAEAGAVRPHRPHRRSKKAEEKRRLWIGRVVPFGYLRGDLTLEIDDGAARIVKRVYGLYDRYRSFGGVARELNRLGVLFKGKYRWRDRSVRKIVCDPVYAGLIRTGRRITKGVNKGIVGIGEYRRMQWIIKHGADVCRSAFENKLLLGKVFCGSCGREMWIRDNKNDKGSSWWFACQKKDLHGDGSRDAETFPSSKLNRIVKEEVAAFMARDRFIRTIADDDHKRKLFFGIALEDPRRFAIGLRDDEFKSLCDLLVERVLVYPDGVEIWFRNIEGVASESFRELVVFRRYEFTRDDGPLYEEMESRISPCCGHDSDIVKAIAVGRAATELLSAGRIMTIVDAARLFGVSDSWMTSAFRMAFLSPRLIERLVTLNCSTPLTVAARIGFSRVWDDQEKELIDGIARPAEMPRGAEVDVEES